MGRQQNEQDFDIVRSPITAVADPVSLRADARLTHCFIGFEFFTSAAGTTSVEPTAGTMAVEVETVNSPGRLEAITGSPLNLATTGRATLNFAANASRVVVTPATVSGNGATHYRAILTANKS